MFWTAFRALHTMTVYLLADRKYCAQVLGDFEDAIKNIRLDAFKPGGDNIQKVTSLTGHWTVVWNYWK